MSKQTKHTPETWRTLDTYEADLRNESPPRRETVTEIQAQESGDLICYANPEYTSLIAAAPDLFEACKLATQYAYGQPRLLKTLEAALTKAGL